MRKISIITAIIFIVSAILPVGVFADNTALDAFENILFTNISSTEIHHAVLRDSGVVGDFNTFAYVVFDNIDFKDGAAAMSYTRAGTLRGTLKVKAVDLNTPIDLDTVREYDASPDFSIDVTPTSSWSSFETITKGGFPSDIKGNKKLVVWVRGSGDNVGDAKSIQFYSNFNNAEITVNENFVTAKLDLYTSDTANATLISAIHNSGGALSQSIIADRKTDVQNQSTDFYIPFTLQNGESVNAFLVDDNMNLLCEPKGGYISGDDLTDVSDKLYAYYNGADFTVTGSTDKDYVIIAMIKKGSNILLLQNAVNVFTVKTVDGKYKISFTDESITSGEYEFINNIGEKYEITYINSAEQKEALDKINNPAQGDGETVQDAFIRVVYENAPLLGITDILDDIKKGEDADTVYSRIYNNGYQYTTVNEFVERVKFANAYQKLISGGNVEEIIKHNAEILGISASIAYKNYYPDSSKDELSKILRGILPNDFSADKQTFKDCFNQSSALEAINRADKWTAVNKIFDDFSAEIYTELYAKKYEPLTKGQKKYIIDRIKGEDYTKKYYSVPDFVALLGKQIANVPSDVEEPTESGISAFSLISAIKCSSMGGKSDIAVRNNDYIGGISYGGWIAFDDVYFDSGAVAMELTYAVTGTNGGFSIYIGDVGTPTEDILKSTPVFTTHSENTGSWSVFKTFGYYDGFPRNITEHKKLVVKGNNISGDIKSIRFYNDYFYGGASVEGTTAKASFKWSSLKDGNITLIGAGYTGDSRVFKVNAQKITDAVNKDVNAQLSLETADSYMAVLADDSFNIKGSFAGAVESADTKAVDKLTTGYSNDEISIYGASDGTVLLGVKKDDVNENDYLNYTHIALVNPKDGKYAYKFTDENMKTGKYVVINSLGEKAEFNYLNVQDIQRIMAQINNPAPADGETKLDAFIRIINQNKDYMYLTDLVDSINESEYKDWIYSTLYNNGETFESFEAFSNKMNFLYVISEIMGSSSDKASRLIEGNIKLLGIDTAKGYKDFYKNMDKLSVAEYLSSLFKADKPSNITTVQKLFNEAIVLNGINNAQGWGTYDKFIKEFESIFNFAGYSDYIKLSFDEQKQLCLNLMDNRPYARALQINVTPNKQSGSSSSKGGTSVKSGKTGGSYGVDAISNTQSNEPQNTKKTLNDLELCKWAQNDINTMYKKGYISGYGDGSFKPNNNISRAEFVHILVTAMNFNAKDNTSINFSDVNDTDWCSDSIKIAYGNGIVNGREDGTFGADMPITREELSAIVYRASLIKPEYNVRAKDINIAFADGDQISDYAYDGVYTLAKAGILNGTGNEIFDAKSNSTRAEAAVIIYRYLLHIGIIRE